MEPVGEKLYYLMAVVQSGMDQMMSQVLYSQVQLMLLVMGVRSANSEINSASPCHLHISSSSQEIVSHRNVHVMERCEFDQLSRTYDILWKVNNIQP